MTNKYSYMHLVRYKSIPNWSAGYILGHDLEFTEKYPLARIGDFIRPAKNAIVVEDDKEYKQVTLKTNGGGAVLRGVMKGGSIGTKKQFLAKEGQFVMSKIDARNGAFGIISKELNGSIVTGDFPLFDVNSDLISTEYLFLISTTKSFVRFAQSCSRGTTNRRRIDVNLFLQQQIPLPSLEEQKSLVDAYHVKLQKATMLDNQVLNGEKTIADFIMQSLGIVISKVDMVKKCISLVSYKEVKDRWDLYNVKSSIFGALSTAKYKSVQIGRAYQFITRGWQKKEEKFRYIEIGSVDSLEGIISATELLTKKAPSRATQKVALGDLIIGTTRPYLKKYSIIPNEYADCVCSSGFQVISNRSNNNLQFLLEYLRTPAAIAQYEFYMTGALYPAITSSDLKKVEIPLPPIEIQEKIIEDVQMKRAKMIKAKEKAAKLRQDAIVQFEQAIFE